MMNSQRGDLPAALLPYQQRWLADTSEVKICEKSRRIGITWATAVECVLEAAQEGDDGQDCWYIGYSEDAALEFVRDVADWAKKLGLGLLEAGVEETIVDNEGEDMLAYQVRFTSGHRVTALTSRPRNLRGKQGYVVIDEAAFHDDLPGLLKAAVAFLIWGGRVAIISTHFGVNNSFNKLCEDVRGGRYPYSLHVITLDQALEDGLYKRICYLKHEPWSQAKQDKWRADLIEFYGDDAQEELFCVPSKSGGAYLSTALIESRMEDALIVRLDLPDTFLILENGKARAAHERTRDFERWLIAEVEPALRRLRKDRPHYFGFDFGRVSDLSVFAPVELGIQLLRTVPFLIELRNVPYDQQREFLAFVVPRLPRFAGGKLDATGNGEALGEYAATTWGPEMCEAVKLNDSWYATHLPPFKAAVEDGLMRLPRDLLVRQDLGAFQMINGTPKLPKAKTSSKRVDGKTVSRHGDSAIALVLGHAASCGGGDAGDYYEVKRPGRTVDPTYRNDDDDYGRGGLGEPRGRGIF